LIDAGTTHAFATSLYIVDTLYIALAPEEYREVYISKRCAQPEAIEKAGNCFAKVYSIVVVDNTIRSEVEFAGGRGSPRNVSKPHITWFVSGRCNVCCRLACSGIAISCSPGINLRLCLKNTANLVAPDKVDRVSFPDIAFIATTNIYAVI
jgi:hypothetical protein